MNVFVSGGTGFVGSALCQALVERGDKPTVLTRHPDTAQRRVGVAVDAVASAAEASSTEFSAVVNLAGEPIADRRWTAERKRQLYASRIDLTERLIDTLAQRENPPKVLISASAVGYYGDRGSDSLNESSTPHPEFSHELCAAWENAALRAESIGMRVCIIRIGLVLGRNGGLLKRMAPPFKMGIGGRLGSGEQWMSWIHRDDLVRIILYLLDHETLHGVFNATAPKPVRNRDFTLKLARQLRRPAALPVPAALLKLGLGEMSQLLLTGQRVIPERLQQAGFAFVYEDLTTALQDILG